MAAVHIQVDIALPSMVGRVQVGELGQEGTRVPCQRVEHCVVGHEAKHLRWTDQQQPALKVEVMQYRCHSACEQRKGHLWFRDMHKHGL